MISPTNKTTEVIGLLLDEAGIPRFDRRKALEIEDRVALLVVENWKLRHQRR